MRSAALVLLVASLTACFDFDRLFPDHDLSVRDQSAVADSGLDLSLFDGEDGSASNACTAHLHDGVWSQVVYGPGGSGSSGVSSIWADPNSPVLVSPYANAFYRSFNDGTDWGNTLTPAQWGPAVWGADPQHLYYVAAPDDANSQLFEMNLSSPTTDLSPGSALAVNLTPALALGGLSLVAGRPGTPLVLFGGGGPPPATVLWDGTTAHDVPISTNYAYAVQALAVSDSAFFRAGYRYLEQSSDGLNWSNLYFQGSDLDNAIAQVLGSSFTVDANFRQVWAGRLPSGKELYVTTLNPAAGSLPEFICWQNEATKCQALPFTPYALWGTGCGVILVVGSQLQAMRYDATLDEFELETQTPIYTTLTVNFFGVTGHADGTALAFTDNGDIYFRN